VNKNQLVAAMTDHVNRAKEDGAPKATLTQSREFLDALLAVVQGSLAEGDKVSLPGFGSWERQFSAARTATNPATGGKIDVPARYRATFKAGSDLKAAVNPEGAR
jgi:DNA-binding protein HU-beta